MSEANEKVKFEALSGQILAVIKDPKRGLLLLGLLVVLCGVGYAKHVVNQSAMDTIDDFMISKHLSPYVTYEAVSASFFGDITISEMEVRVPGLGPVQLPKVIISDVEKDRDMLLSVKVKIPSLEISVQDASSRLLKEGSGSLRAFPALYQPVRGMIAELSALGIEKLDGSYSVFYNYNPRKRTLDIEYTQKDKQIGSFDLSLGLAGLDLRYLFSSSATENVLGNVLLTAITHGIDRADSLELLDGAVSGLDAVFAPLALSNFQVSIDNGPYRSLLKEYPNTVLPPKEEKAKTAVDPSNIETLVTAGVPASEARKMVTVVREWVEVGGDIEIKTNLKRPLPLFRDTVRKPNFENFGEFVSMAKIEITH